MEKTLVNKVEKKAIVTLDLGKFVPSLNNFVELDLAQFLFKGLLLKEKDFRKSLKELDFSIYTNKIVLLHCSTNAIVPKWAYMLVSMYIFESKGKVFFGNNIDAAIDNMVEDSIQKLDVKEFTNKRIVVKGCGDRNLSESIYIKVMQQLQPVAKAINFGEACSMVPVFKKSN